MTSAINLLSNGEFENQKASVFKGLRALISTFCLFPLHRCGGLAGDVVDNSVDALDLVDDAAADLVEQLVGDAGPVSGHEVLGRHSAQRYPALRCGFVHVPYLPEQAKDGNAPSMGLEMMVKALHIAVEAIAEEEKQ